MRIVLSLTCNMLSAKGQHHAFWMHQQILLSVVPVKHQKTHSPRTILNLQHCVWKQDLIFDCEITACVCNFFHQTMAVLRLMLTCAPDALRPQRGGRSSSSMFSSETCNSGHATYLYAVFKIGTMQELIHSTVLGNLSTC